MNFDEYQEGTARTAVYPGQGTFLGLSYAAMGLNGEAGEVIEQVKKFWRDDGGDLRGHMTDIIDRVQHDLGRGMIPYDSLVQTARMRLEYVFENSVPEERREKIAAELGDVLWYAAQVASELNLSLDGVARDNLEKLAARQAGDKLHGEGSDR